MKPQQRDLTPVLRRPVEPAVKSRHSKNFCFQRKAVRRRSITLDLRKNRGSCLYVRGKPTRSMPGNFSAACAPQKPVSMIQDDLVRTAEVPHSPFANCLDFRPTDRMRQATRIERLPRAGIPSPQARKTKNRCGFQLCRTNHIVAGWFQRPAPPNGLASKPRKIAISAYVL